MAVGGSVTRLILDLSIFWTSRVHISQSTMECLHGEFDVEPGDGGDRCDYLRERGIDTYLVVVPKGPVGKNSINGVVSQIKETLRWSHI